MKTPTTDVNFPESRGASDGLSPLEIQRALAAILQSPPFRSSPQIQKVLKFLVLETLNGSGESLKERVIGASLFDRRPDYDTSADPIVRLRVAEVRKRLALYYQFAPDETVLISIPTGSFKPVFEWTHKHPVAPAPRPDPEVPVSPAAQPILPEKTDAEDPGVKTRRFHVGKWWLVTAAVALAMIPVAMLHYLPSPEERVFNKFWAPVFETSKTVLVGMGNNPLYELSNAGEDEYYKNHPKDRFQEMGLHPYIPLAPGAIDSKFINPSVNTYLTIGDVAALSSIEYILAQQHIKLDIRFVNDVTYGDVRQNPTVLIGVHNNIWTLNMTENLRFGFQGHSTIIDRSDPHKQWTANFDRSETYAIVARIFNSWNGKVVLVIGGVGYSGTRAAGDFITNPQSIAKLVKSLPKDWETKNIEVVLHTSVKNQIPSSPDIVAAYAW